MTELFQIPLPGVPYRILVTGWRDWPKEAAGVVFEQLDLVVKEFATDASFVIVTEGQCPYGGVDDYAFAWARAHEPWTVPDRHPADWNGSGKDPGPARNAEMVALGPDICLAFPGPNSRGTRNCIKLAKAAKILVRVFEWEDYRQSFLR